MSLALVGCFSEPPGSGSSGNSTAGGTSSTGTPVDATSAGDTGSSSGSVDTLDPDTGSGSESSTGDLLDCNFDDPVQTGQVPADVVVLVGEQASLPGDFLEQFDTNTNVAIIASETVTTGLQRGVLEACWSGCGSCTPANRVLIPLPAGGGGEAFSSFLTNTYSCMLRPPPPGVATSGPSRQLWLFTESPGINVPEEVEIRILTERFRLHVACPGCGKRSLPANSDLARLVEQTQGSVGDSTGALAGQFPSVTAARTSCIWADDDPPDVLLIDNGFAPINEPFFADDRDALGLDQCEEVFETKEGEELFPLFFVNQDDDVELCPVACRLAQLPAGDGTDIYRCN